MKTYRDKTGRIWTLAMTLGSAMAVKAALGVDLLVPEAGDPPLLARLSTDEALLGTVICELLRPQMEKEGVTVDDILNGFDGETLLLATEAFFAELADFFQSRGRTDRAAAVKKQALMIQKAVQVAEARVNALPMPPELMSGATSGGSPE